MTEHASGPYAPNSLRGFLYATRRAPRAIRQARQARKRQSPEDRDLQRRLHREYMAEYVAGAGPLMHTARDRLTLDEQRRLWEWAKEPGISIQEHYDRETAQLHWLAEVGRTDEHPDVEGFLRAQPGD
jgi:hypothetical protein